MLGKDLKVLEYFRKYKKTYGNLKVFIDEFFRKYLNMSTWGKIRKYLRMNTSKTVLKYTCIEIQVFVDTCAG